MSENITNECSKIKKHKHDLGQFFTTNYEKILDGMDVLFLKWMNEKRIEKIIEPFCGNGILLHFIWKLSSQLLTPLSYYCYDIEPQIEASISSQHHVVKQDTLLNPPNYLNSFILTNPPYLARNKSEKKEIFDKYQENDLYKCFLKEIIVNKCHGGILILPLNFLSSIRKTDVELRAMFLRVYKIEKINIFEEQVFEDTKTSICSIFFVDRGQGGGFAAAAEELNEQNNYLFGGEIYNLKLKNNHDILRLTKKNISEHTATNILVKCIDDKHTPINMKIVLPSEIYVDNTEKSSDRTYMTLIIFNKKKQEYLDSEKQKKLVDLFNDFLQEKRRKYNSLFLPSYREGTRKRISFGLVFQITEFILDQYF